VAQGLRCRGAGYAAVARNILSHPAQAAALG
jgi:hypothetical protein